METHLADWIRNTPDGAEAESILRTCVHCGFCNATCPTYQLLGDELDGPRGRIYQIKQMLEGAPPGPSTQLHLDRCLTCMNCETTCPSGVRYGRLRRHRPRRRRWPRQPRRCCSACNARSCVVVLRVAGYSTARWASAGHYAACCQPGCGPSFRSAAHRQRGRARTHARRVLLLNGCVQPALLPSIDAATARVLDALSVQTTVVERSGCCGAIDFHLDAQAQARDAARRNIDAWWPHVEGGAEAVVINASGCGAMVKDYAHLLRDDAAYANKAQRIAAMTRDLSEFLHGQRDELARLVRLAPDSALRRVAFHPPCTLQHTQKIRGVVEGNPHDARR